MDQAKKMGHVLCTIPFPEPKNVTDRIRARFPGLKITYVASQLTVNWEKNGGLPEG